jgi:hypothetical protein
LCAPRAGLETGVRLSNLSVVPLVLLAACQREPQNPEAGDVVRPARTIDGDNRRGKFATVSVYEQAPGGDNVTTGKRIRFRVEKPYAQIGDRGPGPVFNLTLMYDLDDKQPILGPPRAAPPSTVVATLESHGAGLGLTRQTLPDANIAYGSIGFLPAGSLKRQTAEVCGLDAYEVTADGSMETSIDAYPPPPAGAEFARTFGGSMVFALPGRGGSYDAIIGCSRRSPTCTAATSYRGWPLRVTFQNTKICRYSEVQSSARALLDRFFLEETPRSAGQSEHRWSSTSTHGAAP